MKKGNVKKKKNRADIIQNVVLVVLAVIVLGLCVALALQSDNSVHYTEFRDSMIHINNDGNLKVTANIFEEQQLVVLLEPTSRKDIDVDVQVNFADADGKAITLDSTQATILSDGKNMMFFDVPELDDDKYAGTIDINVKTHKIKDTLEADLSKVTYQETHEVQDDGSTVFHVSGQNQNDATLLGLVGYVVALKDNKIVAYNSFTKERIGANEMFSFDITFHGMSTTQDDKVSPVDYDELMIFSSFAMDDYENE